MNDLSSLIALQSRLYEFLEQQDEATLRGIVSGTVRLAIAPGSASTGVTLPFPDDPSAVVSHLSTLTSEDERRTYLNKSLSVQQLKSVAKRLGLKRYSHLSRAKLIDLIAGHEPSSPEPVNDNSADERQTVTEKARPSPTARSADIAPQNADAAAIATRLREIETEEEGAAFLRAQHLEREGLLAVAAELQLTRVDRLKSSELVKRVLKQAIGARRKFAGLRKW